MEKKLKIAFITNALRPVSSESTAGLESSIYDLIEQLSIQGHEITLYGHPESSCSAKLLIPCKDFGYEHYYKNDTAKFIYNYLVMQNIYKTRDQYDIIHFHFTPGDLTGAFIHNFYPKPTITTIHHPCYENPETEDIFWEDRHEIKKHPAVIFVSNKQKTDFFTHYGSSYKESFVIPWGLNSKIWSNPVLTNKNTNEIVYLGSIVPEKGCHLAIESLLKIPVKNRPYFKIAGHIGNTEYFKEKIEPYLSVKNKIEHIGSITGIKNKQAFLKNAIGVLMPVQWQEPFGMVAIEALAMGTPVIAWNNGALPEIIKNSENGFIVDSIESMTNRIQLLNTIDRNNVRKSYLRDYTMEKCVEKHIDAYCQTIKLNNEMVTNDSSK